MAANSAIFSYETLIHAIAGASVSTRSARSFKEFDSYMPAWQQCLVNDSINDNEPTQRRISLSQGPQRISNKKLPFPQEKYLPV